MARWMSYQPQYLVEDSILLSSHEFHMEKGRYE